MHDDDGLFIASERAGISETALTAAAHFGGIKAGGIGRAGGSRTIPT